MSGSGPAAELPVLLFEDARGWAEWLDAHHATAPGVWLRLAKQGAGLRSLSYAEALDAALCYGWIDSQKRRHDDRSWVQKFTPRGPKSIWSKINREKVRLLTEAGRMRPAGLLAVTRAQADGRWDAAYDSQRNATVPDDLQAALDGDPTAGACFAALDGANRYAILFRVHAAKTPLARANKIAALVAMLARGETIHPPRRGRGEG
ncbi:hypothetical protein tb265_12830 [Gemmatimonadetes bacterium T265]|nr:hypothetical protein tb265_12830 [Gemmatimonadetes bacterium T265]